MAEYLKRALRELEGPGWESRGRLVRALAAQRGRGDTLSALTAGAAGGELRDGADPLAYMMSEAKNDQALAFKRYQMQRQADRDRIQDEQFDTRLLADAINASRKGGRFKTSSSERTSVRNLAEQRRSVKDLAARFKPDYARMAVPGGRRLANYFAGEWGLGTDAAKEAQGWWSDWDALYTLPERNEQFGATLTENERISWRQANIQGEQDPKQIARKIKVIQDIFDRKMTRAAEYFSDSNLPDSAYNSIFGDFEDEPSAPTAPTGKYTVISVEQ